MLTALYTPTNTPVEIISLTPADRRRGKFAHVITLSRTRDFKSYSNLDGDTAMTDTAFVPLALLKDIRHDGLTVDEAAMLEKAKASLTEARLDKFHGITERQAYMNWAVVSLERTHKTPMTDSRETEQAYRLAAIALSRQVTRHI